MKVKMKFDLGSIKSWLLAHGEKVAFGVIGVVFLLLLYSTVQQESLGVEPSGSQPASPRWGVQPEETRPRMGVS